MPVLSHLHSTQVQPGAQRQPQGAAVLETQGWHLCASETLTCLKHTESCMITWLHLMWDAESAPYLLTLKISSFRSDMSHVSDVWL